jgi:hypothetical protein
MTGQSWVFLRKKLCHYSDNPPTETGGDVDAITSGS